jgi:acid stress-induced BolA-like protein IbaG/YrbA
MDNHHFSAMIIYSQYDNPLPLAQYKLIHQTQNFIIADTSLK